MNFNVVGKLSAIYLDLNVVIITKLYGRKRYRKVYQIQL